MMLSGVRFVPCGDAALAAVFDESPSPALARRIAAVHDALRIAPPEGFVESIPGLTSLTILFDPLKRDAKEMERDVLARASAANMTAVSGREWKIPVCYDADLAPDLSDVARECGLGVDAVVEAHSARVYTVYLLGFSPGFPYMGDVDPRLALPRRGNPRARVPVGSVSIAAGYTAIYPQATAGGWHLIGATPLSLFDARRSPPALLAAGDTVRFCPIAREAYERLASQERQPQ